MGWRNSANLSDRCKGALPRIGSDPRSVPHQAACFFQAVDEVTGVQLLARGSLAGSQGGVVCEQLIDVGQLARRAAEVQQAHEGRAALGHLVDGGEGAMLGGQQLACGASCRRGENATLGDKIGQRVVVEAFRTQLFAARLIEGEALRIVGDNGDSPGSRQVAKQRVRRLQRLRRFGLPRQKFFGGMLRALRFGSGQAPYTKARDGAGG